MKGMWVDNIIQFDGKKLELMDPTLAANSDNKEDVKEYIGNENIMYFSIAVIKKDRYEET